MDDPSRCPNCGGILTVTSTLSTAVTMCTVCDWSVATRNDAPRTEGANGVPTAFDLIVKGIRRLEDSLAWICVDAVASPTPQQIKALQAFYPTENLLEVRRRLISGTAKIGPLDPDSVQDFAAVALAGTSLTWRSRTGAEVDANAD